MNDFGANGTLMLKSAKPGPILAIFAGVHGDETAGIEAVKAIAPKLKLKRGKLYLVLANPPAIAKHKRLLKKNLNRCFNPGNKGQSYEDKRARQLMKLLDDCQALLDLHSYHDPVGSSFIICEKPALELANKLSPKLITTNWSKGEPGTTDGYMIGKGKIGLCLECGPIAKPGPAKQVALKAIKQFLSYFDMLDKPVSLNSGKKRIIEAQRVVLHSHKDFQLDKKLKSFQTLRPGQVYGSQNGRKFIAKKGEIVIFPRPKALLGAEAFIIGREL